MSRRRLLMAVVVGAVVVGGGIAVWESSLFKLRTIVVVGNRHTTSAQVKEAAALIPGTRLTGIDAGPVVERVEALPWVATARVARVLPSRIRITVVERVPAAVIQGSGRDFLVDDTGAVLEAGPPGGLTGFPVITGLVLGGPGAGPGTGAAAVGPLPGERIGGPVIGSALAVFRALPRTIRSNVASIAAPAADQLSVTLADQTVIVYGDASALADKNYDLETLLANGRTYLRINLSAPGHPATVAR